MKTDYRGTLLLLLTLLHKHAKLCEDTMSCMKHEDAALRDKSNEHVRCGKHTRAGSGSLSYLTAESTAEVHAEHVMPCTDNCSTKMEGVRQVFKLKRDWSSFCW